MLRIKKTIHTLLAAILAAAFIFSLCQSGGAVFVSAASATSYSNVLTDLMQDEQFNTADYPVNNSDYSLSVIQIAESTDKELFAYVYQPCIAFSDVNATSINIAFDDAAKRWDNYTLTLINRGGTLGKYKVNGVTVGDSPKRIYDISAIFRKFNKVVDASQSGQTVSEVAYPVGQMWTATTTPDSVSYEVQDVEVLEITQQRVGFRRYGEGMLWANTKSCDAHYFAFSTKHSIDYLLSADVEFDTQYYTKLEGQDFKFDEEKEHHFVTLHYYDEGASNKKRWSRMSSMNEFLNNETLTFTDEQRKVFNQYDWILNFYETDYTREAGGADILLGVGAIVLGGIPGLIMGGAAIKDALTTTGTLVTDVTLLRLEFESDNTVYNLGAVSNKQSGGSTPSNQDQITKANKRVGLIAGLVIAAVVVVALIVLSIIYPVVGKVVIKICKWLWFVICLPFRGIKKLAKYCEQKRRERQIFNSMYPKPQKKKKRKKAKSKK